MALKVIEKKNISSKDSRLKIEKEVEVLKRVDGGEGIIQLYEVFEDSKYVYMVFELLENGDLV